MDTKSRYVSIKMLNKIIITLESEINVQVCLLILKDFPTCTALIPDRTFIKS